METDAGRILDDDTMLELLIDVEEGAEELTTAGEVLTIDPPSRKEVQLVSDLDEE